ncbi:MAG: ADP-glyceromanno-heptose 6-epimerase [Arenicellales bacterium]
MILVTGGAGFIGSNLVRALNARGEDDILVVDDLSDSSKIRNLRDCRFTDYLDKTELLELVRKRGIVKPAVICHQGACSDTMESDGRYMMEVNFSYSKALLHYALESAVPFIYASSASVYGSGSVFREDPAVESALNVYAFSKLAFDRYVRRAIVQADSQVVGLRYFNVYGPGETHKGRMASVAFHFYEQYRDNQRMRLFVGSGGYADGAQERDFVWVEDAAAVNLHFMDHPDVSGIFNVGTGRSRSFNDVALAVIRTRDKTDSTLGAAVDAGKIEYTAFPEGLRERYQSYTCADIGALRGAGYTDSFLDVEEGVGEYVRRLMSDDGV